MEGLKRILPAKIYEMLERAGICTPKEIVTLSMWDLKKATNMTDQDINLMKIITANHIRPSVLSAEELESENYVLSGCPNFDKILKGGFKKGTLTELYGESGSGKTQLAMQVAAQCGMDGSVYICTEDIFPVKRFNKISESVHGNIISYECRQNMYIEHLTEGQDLLSCIRVRLPKLLGNKRVSSIIIDSIAAPFRCDNSNYVQRAEDLRELAISLLSIAQKFNCAVICVNQVSSTFDETDDVLPSLGLAWSNMITYRMLLKRTNKVIYFQDSNTNVRELTIVFSPCLPNKISEFIITANGIKFL
ncbi:DNA repair protein XRCC3-like isoform X2 [Colias croceus]|nr:DNA repair protein XRCC3-like isoform X2 [Colias croceus]XP_045502552.1 DNA repair protein XRCC3-like isoform X2 [Colias croceus]XP_045502553.1 DNA repair protein XRCC3-like isoform X2 [Colias croceus]XP_045502554.1 DNA repair protein XRCC3-like isoform X2 [Colias croceus]